jgi:SPW repeat
MARMAQSKERWRDWVVLVLGAWLFLSPWILGFAGGAPRGAEPAMAGPAAAAWNAWVVGALVAALAVWAIAMFAEWQDWLNGILRRLASDRALGARLQQSRRGRLEPSDRRSPGRGVRRLGALGRAPEGDRLMSDWNRGAIAPVPARRPTS